MRRQAGFTLLEVLVALAIVGLVLASALFVLGSRVEQQIRLERQDRARWVAANVLARLRGDSPWPATGQRAGEAEMGPERYHWLMDVTDTDQQGLRRVDVRVFVDAETRHELVRLTTLVAQP